MNGALKNNNIIYNIIYNINIIYHIRTHPHQIECAVRKKIVNALVVSRVERNDNNNAGPPVNAKYGEGVERSSPTR